MGHKSWIGFYKRYPLKVYFGNPISQALYWRRIKFSWECCKLVWTLGVTKAPQHRCSICLLGLSPVDSCRDCLVACRHQWVEAGLMEPCWMGECHQSSQGRGGQRNQVCAAPRGPEWVCVLSCPFSKLTNRHLSYLKKVPLYHMTFFISV